METQIKKKNVSYIIEKLSCWWILLCKMCKCETLSVRERMQAKEK